MTAVLALLGAVVMWRLFGRARRRTNDASRIAREFLDLVEFVAAGVEAGLSPMAAIDVHADLTGGEAGTRDASRAWNGGHSAHEALTHIVARCGAAAQPFCGAVHAALHDGQPVADTLARLSREARGARERHADAAVARVPVRLAVPLVVCVLPSYVLVGSVPIITFAREAFS